MKSAEKSGFRLEERIGVACMAVLTAITLGNVVVRYFTDESFAWTEEISVFLLVVMTLAGAATVARRDGHIRIEYFYDGGTIRRKRTLRVVAAGATVLLFAALALLFGIDLVDQIRWGETSMGLGVPRWWFTAAIPPLCLAVAASAAAAGRDAWRGRGLDPVGAADPEDGS